MEIKNVKSIELDRSIPFRHVVKLKDSTGHTLETIPVNESTGWEQFSLIYKSWCNHPDFHPKQKKG